MSDAGQPRRAGSAVPVWVELAGAAGAGPAVLRTLGIEPLQYRAGSGYLCLGPEPALRAAARARGVRRVALLSPEEKPRASFGGSGRRDAWIVALAGEDPAALARALRLAGARRLGTPSSPAGYFLRLSASLDAAAQERVLGLPAVLAVEPREPAVPTDEVAGLLLAGRYDAAGVPFGSYLEWLGAHDLDGAGVTIGVVDSGVDVDHPAFEGRIRDLANGKKSWHGTAMAGLAAGRYLEERDERGFLYGLGVAPGADLLAQDRFLPPAEVCRQTATEAGPSGALGTVQCNSFGKGTRDPMDYGSEEALYDRMVRDADPGGPGGPGKLPRPLAVCFAAGNQGTKGLTRPAGAKNVLAVGNTSVHRPQDGGVEAESIDEVYPGDYDTGFHASGLGNCGDGRIRPHVVAPGQWAATAGYGSAPGGRKYLSPRLTWGGGTSAATALAAGACALLVQWWRRPASADPSPAMLRAMLVNGAVDTGDGGPIPNRRQGWGRIHLQNVVAPGLARAFLDQTVLLEEPGEARRFRIQIADPARPLKVTLAWTDPPGALGSGTAETPAMVNRLALRVETGGRTYHGNHFEGGWSVPGPPEREGWDNLQNVYLPPGAAGEIVEVAVVALEIAMDALTGRVEPPRQDFALWISNGFPEGEEEGRAAGRPLSLGGARLRRCGSG